MLDYYDKESLSENELELINDFIMDCDTLEISELNNKYHKLGYGDSANVYQLNDKIAIKKYYVDENRPPKYLREQFELFMTEINNFEKLKDYSSFARLYGYDKENMIIIMELVHGNKIEDLLYEDIEDGDNEMWVQLFLDVFAVFEEKQLDFKDLHNGNIIKTNDNKLKVIDFQHIDTNKTKIISLPAIFQDMEDMFGKDNNNILKLFHSFVNQRNLAC